MRRRTDECNGRSIDHRVDSPRALFGCGPDGGAVASTLFGAVERVVSTLDDTFPCQRLGGSIGGDIGTSQGHGDVWGGL